MRNPPSVREMCRYSPPGSRPSGVEMYAAYGIEVARMTGISTAYPRITLGPVSLQASLVTLKMPAPIKIPISVAYDSRVPRSRRRRETGVSEFDVERELLEFETGIRHSHSHPD